MEGDLVVQDLAWAFPVVRIRRGAHPQVVADHNLQVEEGLLALEDHIRGEVDPGLAGRSRQEEDLGQEGNLLGAVRILLEDDRLGWAEHHLEVAEDAAEVGGDRDLDQDPDLGGLVGEDRRLQGLGHAEKRVLGGRWWMGWRKVQEAVGSSLRPS